MPSGEIAQALGSVACLVSEKTHACTGPENREKIRNSF